MPRRVGNVSKSSRLPSPCLSSADGVPASPGAQKPRLHVVLEHFLVSEASVTCKIKADMSASLHCAISEQPFSKFYSREFLTRNNFTADNLNLDFSSIDSNPQHHGFAAQRHSRTLQPAPLYRATMQSTRHSPSNTSPPLPSTKPPIAQPPTPTLFQSPSQLPKINPRQT